MTEVGGIAEAGRTTEVGGPREWGPWLWGPRIDLPVFLGTALLAVGLVAGEAALADESRALPSWGFFAFIVAIDVAHVYSTLFRTYFDTAEVARRPSLYYGVPLACFGVGALLYSVDSSWFWRALAYVALTHFIRQQVGWVAIYRARAGIQRRLDRLVDDAAIYTATLVPVAYWHANLPRRFHWFVPGDFVGVAALGRAMPFLFGLLAAVLGAYAALAIRRVVQGEPVQLGKHIVVSTTALTWYVGIVLTNSDFAFSVANVIVHGVPYVAFLYFYALRSSEAGGGGLGGRIVRRAGLLGFCASLLVLAFAEEFLWDRLVWHGKHQGFGGDWLPVADLDPILLAVVVPLLATPQATHYVLDAVLWRRGDTGRAQARAMGFAGAPRPNGT